MSHLDAKTAAQVKDKHHESISSSRLDVGKLAEHMFQLEYIFHMCSDYGLKVDKKNIDILPEQLKYLGVCINCEDKTYCLHRDWVQACSQWMRPVNNS